MWREDGGTGSFNRSPSIDDVNGVRMIVPRTNLNIDHMLNLESLSHQRDKLHINFQAATAPQRSRDPGAKTLLDTNLQLAEALASTSNTASLNVFTRRLLFHKHQRTITLLERITSTQNTGS